MVRFHPHARERLAERGATEEEVRSTVLKGETFSAKFGRTGFRRNFRFDSLWRGKYYAVKQVEVFAVREGEDWLVITVLARSYSFIRAIHEVCMKLNYDPRYNIAYLRLQEKTSDVETIHLSDEINVDLAPDGTVYGIELLNANVQLAREDAGQLVL